MEYTEAMEYISSTLRFGSILGLDRMESLMKELGFPCKTKKIVHVAGTNGKGSTSIMIANILACAGHKVGLYTSPFINRFSERIRIIEGETGAKKLNTDEVHGEISNKDFADCITIIKSKVEKMLEEGVEHPTEFELVSAAAFMHFEKNNCDYIVLETGLGGRLDSTNVFPAPLKCVITPIGYDHMDRLGNTILEIAFEKAGIIKAGAQVIVSDPEDYAVGKDAQIIKNVIKKKCKEVNAKSLEFISSKDILEISYSIHGQEFSINSPKFSIDAYTPLLGTYQPANAYLAGYACKELASNKQIIEGIKLSKWPARLEVLKYSNPTVIIDGAHNPEGTKALVKTLDKLIGKKQVVFLFGAMKDKDVTGMLKNAFDTNTFLIKAFFATKPQNERALDTDELIKIAVETLDKTKNRMYNKEVEFFQISNPADAIRKAYLYSKRNGYILLAFGSLYMSGSLRDEMKRLQQDEV